LDKGCENDASPAWHQARLRVIAFHLGVQPNGVEITMSRFNQWSAALAREAIENPFRLFGVS